MRRNLSLGFSKDSDQLIEAVFTEGAKLFFQGEDLFLQSDPISFVRHIEPSPKLCLGFVVFPKLGLRFSGFHDKDESQKAIAVTKSSYWAQYTDEFEPFP